MIPLIDLKLQYTTIRPQIDAAIRRVLDDAAFILGREVEQFEEAFAAYCETRHAIGVASGTAALHLALMACGVQPGDEVITTPLTFVATAEAISHAGARPVFVDIDPVTYNLDPAHVEAAITSRTRAIVPVHLYGRPADMDPLLDTARRKGLVVVEDAAQAHGARYRGRRVGSMGKAAAFSFYPGKNLGAYGDGGMVVTSDDEVATRLRMLRDHGRRQKFQHEIIGYGERLDALQAAILGVKLRHLDAWNAARRTAAHQYQELLGNSEAVLPQSVADSESVFHLFVVRVRKRDHVLRQLHAVGVGAAVHYPIPIHLQLAYAHAGYAEGSFPHAEAAARDVLSLPMYPEISDGQLTDVAQTLNASLRNTSRLSSY